jgi:hypothetical protein
MKPPMWLRMYVDFTYRLQPVFDIDNPGLPGTQTKPCKASSVSKVTGTRDQIQALHRP